MDGAATIPDAMSERDEEQISSLEGAGSTEETPPEILPERVVEAILFASDSPLAPSKIASLLGTGDARDVRNHIATLNGQYEQAGLSFRVEEIAGGYRLLTLPSYNTWLVKLLRAREDARLSPAALETLAIVAYKQPATRADIEVIRGVAAGDMLNRLREANLVKIVGRAEDLGRPLLYGTTKHFLEVFGLASLEDLPQVEALRPAGTTSPKSVALAGTNIGSSSTLDLDSGDSPEMDRAESTDPPTAAHLTLVHGDDEAAESEETPS